MLFFLAIMTVVAVRGCDRYYICTEKQFALLHRYDHLNELPN